jgi:succinate dehydrogenase/fumarate reductase cytochrome b subunit
VFSDRTQLKNGDIELSIPSTPTDQSSTSLDMYAFSNALSLSGLFSLCFVGTVFCFFLHSSNASPVG